MWFFQSGARPTSQSVKITDFRTQRFEVLSIECTSELFSVRQTSDKPRLDGGREITLEVSTTGEIPPGRHRGIVVVETDDPRYPYIRIPVGCQPMDDQPATESAAPEPEPEPERGPQTP